LFLRDAPPHLVHLIEKGVVVSRSFDAGDIVVLPVLDVSSAITLGGEILTAAKAAETTKKLPKTIKKSLDVVHERHQALRSVSAERLNWP
jgi:hypothetical protein